MQDFQSYANFTPLGCLSDHFCCVVSLLHDEQREQWPFKFYNIWTLHEGFRQLVDSSYEVLISNTVQFILKQKLSRLKPQLHMLNEFHFQHILQQEAQAKTTLDEAQACLLSGEDPPTDYHSLHACA